jgi:lycopene beta-cyclase
MHFRGWEIQTPEPQFDPETITFLDFRTPQENQMRFFYVLPFARERALVEYTIFSKSVLKRRQYEQALRDYLAQVLKIQEYEIVSEERGSVPITDDPLIREIGKRVMAIGARAGRIKPSTGYAFMRVQKDSDEIVESLLLYGHPFNVPDDPDLYDVLDAVMLKAMHLQGQHIKTAFTAMFKRNPIEHILRFLDEESSPWENLMLIASMPPQLFLQALFQVATKENLFEIMKG